MVCTFLMKRAWNMDMVIFQSSLSLPSSSGVMDDMEHGCYSQWFDYVTKHSPPQLDLIGRYNPSKTAQWVFSLLYLVYTCMCAMFLSCIIAIIYYSIIL